MDQGCRKHDDVNLLRNASGSMNAKNQQIPAVFQRIYQTHQWNVIVPVHFEYVIKNVIKNYLVLSYKTQVENFICQLS